MDLKLYNCDFGSRELTAVRKVLKSGILTKGPRVEEFEQKFAEFIEAPYVVAVNSCTSALYLSLVYYLKTHKKVKIKIPSVTFVSVANNLKHLGIKFSFDDKVYVGNFYYLKGTNIIDSAHFLDEGCYVPKSFMCFSFYPTKVLGGAEGGVIATDDKQAYEWFKKARSNGMERKGMLSWNYQVDFAGWKMEMTDMQAAILLTRLKKIVKHNHYKWFVRWCFNKNLGYCNHSLHLYPIFVHNRDKFIEQIKKKGIQCSVHFKPIHLQPAYKTVKKLPYSEWWGKHEVSIPFHENLSVDEILYIIKQVKKYGHLITKINSKKF